MKSELKTDAATNELPNDQYVIRCYFVPPLMRPAITVLLTDDRRLAFEAMRLLIRLDRLLREARADWNQDRFRRLMRLRTKAVARVRRRWAQLNLPPLINLGTLRRRYSANLAGYLYSRAQPGQLRPTNRSVRTHSGTVRDEKKQRGRFCHPLTLIAATANPVLGE